MVFRELAGLPAMMRQPVVDDNLREVFRSQSMRNLLSIKSWGPKRFAQEQQRAADADADAPAAGKGAAAGAPPAAADVETARSGGGGGRRLHHRTSGSHGGEFDAAGSLGSPSCSSASSAALTMVVADGSPSSAAAQPAPAPPPPKTALGRGLARVRKALGSPTTRGEKAACGVFWAVFAAGILTLFVWGFPKLVDKGIKPAIAAVKAHLTPVQIAAVVFFGYVIVPCSFFIGPNSFIWMAGLCFPFWQSVLLIEAASCVGVLVPFFLGKTILRRSAARLLARSKPMQVAVRAVDEHGPWKVLAIIRLGPIPYAWCNYMCAIPHNVPWFPYLVVSVICHAPINIMNILFGQNLKGFADLLRGKVTDPIVLAYNVVGIVVIAVFCALGAWGARRALRSLEAHQREQRELQQRQEREERERGEAAAAEMAAKAQAKEASLAGSGSGSGGDDDAPIKASGGGGGGEKSPLPRVVASDAGAEQGAAAAAEQVAEAAASPALLPRRSHASEAGPAV